jgi:4-hydroxybenzoate polyprenyltransferase
MGRRSEESSGVAHGPAPPVSATVPNRVPRPAGALRTTLEMIRFSHTVFALPFAILSAVLAAGGWPDAATLGKILLAMVGARSAAMAHNRLADRELDATNPRTAGRALPAGTLSVDLVYRPGGFVLGSGLAALGLALTALVGVRPPAGRR